MEQLIEFARGGGGMKAKAKPAAKAGAVVAGHAGGGAAGLGSGYNGTINGKRGFQPGNKYGGQRKNAGQHSAVQQASNAHRSARATVSAHVKAGTLSSPEGKASVRASASAARQLQSARSAQKYDRSVASKTQRAVASGRAVPLASRPATPGEVVGRTPAPKAAPAIKASAKARVEKSMKVASAAKVDQATKHIHDLHAGAKAGHLKATDIHKHVERIARGASKDELFAAAKSAGHNLDGIKTKKLLVEHLKAHAQNHADAAHVAPKAETPKVEAAPAKMAHEPPDPGHHPDHTHPDDAHLQARFREHRTPGPGTKPASVPHGEAGDRQIAATIKHAIEHPDSIAGGKGHESLVAIHKLRDHVEQVHGDVGAARFDRVFKGERSKGDVEAIAISDNRLMGQRELDRSIPGMNETIAYAVPHHEQDYGHAPHPATPKAGAKPAPAPSPKAAPKAEPKPAADRKLPAASVEKAKGIADKLRHHIETSNDPHGNHNIVHRLTSSLTTKQAEEVNRQLGLPPTDYQAENNMSILARHVRQAVKARHEGRGGKP